jgi:hypothetical protein
MTPKDKALDLVNKFTVVGLQQRNEGIQCALMCVDELIKATTPLTSTYYWEDVKQEIENL